MGTEAFENLRLELRRGSLILAVLAELRSEQYGYTLRKALGAHGMDIDEGTLYPLLRRLEAQGLLVSQWREQDKRNKDLLLQKFISPDAYGQIRTNTETAAAQVSADYAQLGMPSVPNMTSVLTQPAQAATFGQITATVNSPRQFQFGARFTF